VRVDEGVLDAAVAENLHDVENILRLVVFDRGLRLSETGLWAKCCLTDSGLRRLLCRARDLRVLMQLLVVEGR
jgi:hypothetical protein